MLYAKWENRKRENGARDHRLIEGDQGMIHHLDVFTQSERSQTLFYMWDFPASRVVHSRLPRLEAARRFSP